MKKWCIKVTEENLPVVGKWFNENSQIGIAKDYAYWYLDKTYIGGYLHYPLMEDGLHYDKYIQKGYTEITFEQFKEQILKGDNQLQEILDKIKAIVYYNDYDDKIVNYKDIEKIFAEYGITKTEHNF